MRDKSKPSGVYLEGVGKALRGLEELSGGDEPVSQVSRFRGMAKRNATPQLLVIGNQVPVFVEHQSFGLKQILDPPQSALKVVGILARVNPVLDRRLG